jgi:hypothetical protein
MASNLDLGCRLVELQSNSKKVDSILVELILSIDNY